MSVLTSLGIGSGLDINQLVSQLLQAESAPQTALLDKKEATLTARISGYGLLKSALSELQSAVTTLNTSSTYNNRNAQPSDRSKFTATATASAAFGSYSVEITQLAESHKLSSAGFAATSTVVGTGSLTLTVGSDAFTLTIDDTNKTLAGIRDAINNATGNTGVSATIVNVDDGSGGTEARLVLTAEDTGSDNSIRVTAVNGAEGDLQQLVYDPLPAGSGVTNLTERNPAQDAIVLIDSQTVTSSSNTLVDAIEGVTINLVDADPGNPLTLDIDLSTTSISSAVDNLVDKYNEFLTTLDSLTAHTDEATGSLNGDSLARVVGNQVRQVLGSNVNSIKSANGLYDSLVSIGITTNDDGSLSLNTSTLNTAIGDDLTTITNLFTASDGLAVRLDDLLDDYLDTGAVFDSKTKGLQTSIDNIADQREQLAIRMEAMQAALLDRFVAMDSILQQLNKSSSFLTQALSNLPKPDSGS